MNMDKEIVELFVDDIIPNRFQPREIFDEKALNELAASIKEHGVIQPIIVRKIGDKYEIIAGERRYKASIIAGLTKIPAIIRDLDDKESSKVALLENLQRRDLTAIEEARTYQKILDLDTMTQEELGKTMGKSQAAIANKLRLLALPDEVQEALLTNKISERHARSLLNVKDKESQIKLLNKIIDNKMTVRDLDNEIKAMTGEPFKQDSNPAVGDVNMPNDNLIPNMNPVPDLNPVQNQEPIETENKIESMDSSEKNESSQSSTDASTEGIPSSSSFRFIPNFDEEDQESPKPEPKNDKVQDMDLINDTPLILPDENVSPQTQPMPLQLDDIENLEEEVHPANNIPYQPFTNTESLLNEFRNVNNSTPVDSLASANNSTPPTVDSTINSEAVSNLKSAVGRIRDLVTQLESNGFVIHVDEMDFENKYQINISIDKNQ